MTAKKNTIIVTNARLLSYIGELDNFSYPLYTHNYNYLFHEYGKLNKCPIYVNAFMKISNNILIKIKSSFYNFNIAEIKTEFDNFSEIYKISIDLYLEKDLEKYIEILKFSQ